MKDAELACLGTMSPEEERIRRRVRNRLKAKHEGNKERKMCALDMKRERKGRKPLSKFEVNGVLTADRRKWKGEILRLAILTL